MAGTYKLLNDELVLFTLIGDTSERLSMWAYLPISRDDRAKVDSAEFDSPTQMREFIEGLFTSREATFALARDLRVWRWMRQMVPVKDGLLSAAADSIEELVKAQSAVAAPDVHFQAELAQAEVITNGVTDLVDA